MQSLAARRIFQVNSSYCCSHRISNSGSPNSDCRCSRDIDQIKHKYSMVLVQRNICVVKRFACFTNELVNSQFVQTMLRLILDLMWRSKARCGARKSGVT